MRLGAVAESEGFGRLSMEGIKVFARLKLQEHPAILKQIEDEPDHLPPTSATIDKVLIYW